MKKAFFWGGAAAVLLIALGLGLSISSGNYTTLLGLGIVGVLAFMMITCLILDNNFVSDMMESIWNWGWEAPGLIFTLDLDGIIWLITVKLLFWIIGKILSLLCAILALVLGLALSPFAFPFAIHEAISEAKEEAAKKNSSPNAFEV